MSKPNISGGKQRQIKAAVAEIVGTKLATMDPAAGDRLISRLTAFGKHVEPGLIAAIDEFSSATPSVLKLVSDNIQLDAVAAHNPAEFFKTRKGLWVSDEFRSRVLSKAKPVETLDPVTLSSYELTKNAYDREITPELGENYIFDESEVCARIAAMIDKQPNGIAGDLLNNDDHVNLFYVAGLVVTVRWCRHDRKWLVFASPLDDECGSAGDRVYSHN